MSLVPLLFSNWWEDLERPHSILDQDFGHGLHPEQLLSPALLENFCGPRHRGLMRTPQGYCRPWAELARLSEGGGKSTVKCDKDKFEVGLDVQHFKPEEITVKVVDKCVIVEGKHEEKKDDHGSISRQFIRKYLIPDQCDIDKVSSHLSSDGVLSIVAPRKEQPMVMEDERPIPIQQTGKPAIREGENQAAKKAKK